MMFGPCFQNSYLHENSIKILPSLTKNLIKLHGVKENKFKVLIINQLGQIVIEIENERSIDVSNLNAGVYYLKLSHSNTFLQSKFIVK